MKRLVVQFTEAGQAEGAAQRMADEMPGGKVLRVSPRGRAVIAVDGDVGALAARANTHDDVEWAEPDAVERAQS